MDRNESARRIDAQDATKRWIVIDFHARMAIQLMNRDESGSISDVNPSATHLLHDETN